MEDFANIPTTPFTKCQRMQHLQHYTIYSTGYYNGLPIFFKHSSRACESSTGSRYVAKLI